MKDTGHNVMLNVLDILKQVFLCKLYM